MKIFLILALAVIVLLVWLRSGLRVRSVRRGNLMELLMFGLALVGLIGLILLAGRLF